MYGDDQRISIWWKGIRTGDHRNSHRGGIAMEKVDGDIVLAAVLPVGFRNRKIWLGTILVEVRWNVHFNTSFFGELGSTVGVVGFRITTRDQDAAVIKELRVRVKNGVCGSREEFLPWPRSGTNERRW